MSDVGSGSIKTNFATLLLFLESQTYSLTLNSSPEDHEQSLKKFLKSIKTFEILSDSVKEKPDTAKNFKAQKDKEKKGKGD